MPEPPTIATLFQEAGKLLRARFDAIRATNPHSGEGGAEVEEILKQFLNEHLPQRFRAGSGIVIDSGNQLSRQQDLIIYDALSSPLYRYAPKTQIVPMDAVVTVIEVKSRLTKSELRDSYEKIASCKRLKKREMAKSELQANPDGRFHGTTGIVFAFESATSLDAILENVKELNDEFPSFAWPEMIVVLGSGLITYMIQYPGAQGFAGSLMSVAYPPGWEKRGGPPWYIHLAVHRDAEFALNRFFLALLSQVAFFPVLSRVPPFDVMLQGASNEVMTRAGYQFDLAGVLRAAPENAYITPTHNPVVDRAIDVLAPNGARVAALQYLPWQDGAVIRAFGMEPIIKQLMVTLAIPKDTLLVVDPSQPNMWLTTITKISESEFRRWATVIERKSNLRTKLIWGKEQRGASDIGRSQT